MTKKTPKITDPTPAPDLEPGDTFEVVLRVRSGVPKYGNRRTHPESIDFTKVLKNPYWRRVLQMTRDRAAYSDPELELLELVGVTLVSGDAVTALDLLGEVR